MEYILFLLILLCLVLMGVYAVKILISLFKRNPMKPLFKKLGITFIALILSSIMFAADTDSIDENATAAYSFVDNSNNEEAINPVEDESTLDQGTDLA